MADEETTAEETEEDDAAVEETSNGGKKKIIMINYRYEIWKDVQLCLTIRKLFLAECKQQEPLH